jgi:hypothetical protein
MTRITVPDELAHQIARATDEILLCDPAGNVVARVPPPVSDEEELRSAFTPEEIAEAEKRLQSEGPWYTTEEVLAHLRSVGFRTTRLESRQGDAMTRITVPDDLAHQIAGATDGIVLCDSAGKVLARIPPSVSDEEQLRTAWTKEEIAEAQRRAASPGPWRTTAEVLAHLDRMDEQCQGSQ